MNDSYKYRAWDIDMKEMVGVSAIQFEPNSPAPLPCIIDQYNDVRILDDVILMQFTGRYDKKKKPIYDGDIITFTRNVGNYQIGASKPLTTTHIVKWESCVCRFGLTNKSEGSQKLREHPNYIYEVIGNVYQNPEFLYKK